jgi:malonyl CoA-acyl carrier protein transacylase/NAD(P)-dependent dehydrogenase (short-subunit alcohol dehydrogenase family)
LLALGHEWVPFVFPAQAFTPEQRAQQAEALTDTRVAQPALGMADLAVAELLRVCGVEPDMVAGHSYGELAALCIAGALDETDLLALSKARGEAILDAAGGGDAGTMAAVAADASVVAPIIAGCEGVVIANHNSPRQCVLSGTTRAIDMALVLIKDAGLAAKRIPVACAFHSAVVADAKHALARRLADVEVHAPRLPVYSNVTAGVYPADRVRELLAEQVASPVRFAEEIEAMYAAGARVFAEVGPGQVLSRLVDEILGDRPHVAVSCDGGVAGLLRALAALAVSGVAVDPSALCWDRDTAVLDLAAPPPRPASWVVNGQAARPANGEPPKPAIERVKPQSVRANGAGTEPAPVNERDGAVLEYLRNMRAMIGAQRDVMLAYLGSAPAAVVEAPARAVIDVVATKTPEPAPAPKPVTVDPLQLVVSIVSERTGYPPETLGLDLDLEADLSIDSIKRIEIIGELAQRLGLRVDHDAGAADAMVEELAVRKTLRALVAWLTERLAGAPAEPPAPPADTHTSALASAPLAPAAPEVGRYVLARVPAPMPVNNTSTFRGQRFALCGDDRIDGLAAHLAAEGAAVHLVVPGEPIGAVDGYVELAASDDTAAMRGLFERVRDAAIGGAQRVIIATSAHAGGPAGLLKTLAAEYPSSRVRVVGLDAHADVGAVLHAELHAFDPHVEISYRDGERTTFELASAEPLDVGAVPLDGDSVVLVTGGARGITARTAIALVERFGCHVELVGRSQLPTGDDPGGDARALRSLFAKCVATPAEIEALVARTLADREIRATLAALGHRVTYHAVDVRTPEFGALVDDIYARRGRIDAVIHGAGVLEDKLIRHKTGDSFERVFATKVTGAHTLAAKLRDDVKLVVWFSSIVGALGNRGQADYAAAGDALDKLAHRLQARVRGRVISLDWGPWAGTGMVTPELEREYARRGLALIDPERGIEALLAELSAPAGDSQVILCASDPRALVKTSRPATGAQHD